MTLKGTIRIRIAREKYRCIPKGNIRERGKTTIDYAINFFKNLEVKSKTEQRSVEEKKCKWRAKQALAGRPNGRTRDCLRVIYTSVDGLFFKGNRNRNDN